MRWQDESLAAEVADVQAARLLARAGSHPTRVPEAERAPRELEASRTKWWLTPRRT